jgi:DMSO/TMAO reductase YedYZ molybdopterin-dependent catalytic subunit
VIFARVAATLLAVFVLVGAAAAQTPSLTLDGKVKRPQHWTLDDLHKMPARHADVTYLTERGPVSASFTGVPLWSLIEAAGGIDDAGKGAAIRHAIRITAKDGWVVVTSTGEIAPDFGGKQALVAYERDGKPLDGFRTVIPGDKHGARDARDVVTITVE